eukprot:TRINITY_DN681_c1_g3_i1.p1 TRINITY_DN681_c1_g3~~TRINITY_DN681_c1_g3_i1.p1  ORF type:complete len:362 (+),score=50.93 TRINITY_DN681_c1_g3_i1:69-1154(+)
MKTYLNNASEVYPLTIPVEDAKQNVEKAAAAIVEGWDSSEGVEVTVISGGITNLLFKLVTKKHSVLVRVYGVNTEVMIDRKEENRIFAHLSKIGFAPTYYGQFENGRVEGWLEARPLDFSEMGNPSIQVLVASKLREMHALRLEPISEPLLFSKIRQWLTMAGEVSFDDPEKQKYLKNLNLPRIATELLASEKVLTEDSSPVMMENVFAHQDLLCGNILKPTDENDKKVIFIDFEYGGYNYRGFDIGNHFAEHAGYDCNYEASYPSDEMASSFIRLYFPEASDAEVQKLTLDAHRFATVSHLYWGTWSVLQAKYSPIDFDFLEYAMLRFAGYYFHKSRYFTKSESHPTLTEVKEGLLQGKY